MTTRSLDTALIAPTDVPAAGEALSWSASFRTLWAGFAPLASPTFTGDPKAPTPAPGDNDTSVATTAFVQNAISGSVAGVASFNTRQGAVVLTNGDVIGVLPGSNVTPAMDSVVAAAGSGTAWSRSDHVHPSDTSKLAVSAGAAVNPTMNGVAAPGVAVTYSRGDHVHPSDTSRVAKVGDTMSGPIVLPAGSAAATSINFGTAGTGIFGGNATQFNMAAGGALVFAVSSGSNVSLVPMRVLDGIVTAPGFAFQSENNSGFWRAGVADIRLSVGGEDVVKWLGADNSETHFGPLVLPNTGTAAATSINFGVSGSGIYSPGNQIKTAVGGVEIFSVTAAFITAYMPHRGADGLVNAPTYSFTGEVGSGFYRAGAGDVRLSMGSGDAIKILTSDPTYGGRSVDAVAGPIKEFGIPISQRYAGGYRNLLRRNGGFELWQRGAGGAASIAVGASTTAYAADGWYLKAGANQASVVSQQAGIADGSQWCARIQRNSGQTGFGAMVFGFPLDTDELYPMLGKFVRLSATVRAGANWSPASGALFFYLAVGTGTPVKQVIGYTGQTLPISAAGVLLTTSAVRFQTSSTVFIPTTTQQAEVNCSWTPVGTAGAADYFEIDDVQLEIVPDANQVASPFERLNFAETLALCQRHYQKTFFYNTAPTVTGFAGSDTGEILWIAAKAGAVANILPHRYPVPLRVSPTVLTFNPLVANQHPRDGSNSVDCVMGATVNMKESGGRMGFTGNAATTVASLIQLHITLDAGI